MKRNTILLTLLLLTLAACGGAETPAAAVNSDNAPTPDSAVIAENETSGAPAANDTAGDNDPAANDAPMADSSENEAVSNDAVSDDVVSDDPVATDEAGVPETGAVVTGQNEDGTFFIGNPDAPVTLLDYSDFL